MTARTSDLVSRVLIGALLGLTWAAGFRGYMVEVAGDASVFSWYATFVAVLGGGAIVGGLLGWADHIRRNGGRQRWWLALSPLVLAVLPLTVPGAIAQLSRGIGTAGMGVALLAIGLGFALGSSRSLVLRVVIGVLSLAGAVTLVAMTPLISDGRISFAEPRGAWAGVLALGSILVLGLATSIPFRRGAPERRDEQPTL